MAKLAMHCVTVGEYQKFLDSLNDGDRATHTLSYWKEQSKRPNWPVRWVSAVDADAYAEWAGVRIPTEEEWLRGVEDITPSGLWEWTLSMDGAARVVRGGSWFVSMFLARAIDCFYILPHHRLGYLGFRVVCS